MLLHKLPMLVLRGEWKDVELAAGVSWSVHTQRKVEARLDLAEAQNWRALAEAALVDCRDESKRLCKEEEAIQDFARCCRSFYSGDVRGAKRALDPSGILPPTEQTRRLVESKFETAAC